MEEKQDASNSESAEATAKPEAYKPTELKTKLGSCNMVFKGQLRNDRIQKLADFALMYLIWHIIPQKAFAKDMPFKRDAAFSPELVKHLRVISLSILGDYYSDISLEMSQYVAPDSAEGIIAKIDKLDAAGIAKIEAKLAAAKAKQKPVVATPVVAAA